MAVRFLHGREDATGAAIRAIVERFNAENADVEVKFEVIGSGTAQTEKQTAQTLVGAELELPAFQEVPPRHDRRAATICPRKRR